MLKFSRGFLDNVSAGYPSQVRSFDSNALARNRAILNKASCVSPGLNCLGMCVILLGFQQYLKRFNGFYNYQVQNRKSCKCSSSARKRPAPTRMSDFCRDNNRRPWLAFARTNVANFAMAFATNMFRPLTGWNKQRDPAERPKQK
jgi:hypothetical protein